MFTTIDFLEEYTKNKKRKLEFIKFFGEIKIFLLIFLFVSFVVSLITNRTVFSNGILTMIGVEREVVSDNVFLSQNNDAFTFAGSSSQHSSADSESNSNIQKLRMKQIDKILVNNNIGTTDDFVTVAENDLKKKLNTYQVFFNTLPPTNRIIIPKLDQNTPIVIPQFDRPIEQIKQGDFEKELYKGVVKYPSTIEPGLNGNTLIFGHTSYEEWKHNPYGSIFSNIPKLVIGDDIQIVRKGKLVKYKVVEKIVVSPKQVNQEFIKYNDKGKNYLTIMGCYPIGTDKNRIMIVSEIVE